MREIMQDWMTIWSSELAAIAVDREAKEGFESAALAMSRLVAAFGESVDAVGQLKPFAPSAQTGHAPRPAPVADASGAGGDVARLEARIAELERQLAERS